MIFCKSTACGMVFRRDKKAVRPAAVAGSFYPADAKQLGGTVAGFLASAKAVPNARIRAVIAPHAGYIYSGAVAAEAFAGLKALCGKIKRLVIIGPAHYVRFRGIAAPSVEAFQTPLGQMPLDTDAVKRLSDLPQVVADDTPHRPEHALEVELPFLLEIFGPLPIIPLIVGAATACEVAEVLDRLWDDATVVVVSSDLSHYHDYETTRRLDGATAAAIERLDEEAIGFDDACGALAVRGLLIEAKRRRLVVERLDLRNSGDTAGDRKRVVGYGAWAVRAA
jgi:AmmeMemoRadiSam system protein B